MVEHRFPETSLQASEKKLFRALRNIISMCGRPIRKGSLVDSLGLSFENILPFRMFNLYAHQRGRFVEFEGPAHVFNRWISAWRRALGLEMSGHFRKERRIRVGKFSTCNHFGMEGGIPCEGLITTGAVAIVVSDGHRGAGGGPKAVATAWKKGEDGGFIALHPQVV